MTIKNLEKAAERIKKAVKDNERIILYGDSDCDGVTSVVILQEAIQSLGSKVSRVFFPDRENDGYGVNARALGLLKELSPNVTKTPTLFITLDLGITNNKEVLDLNKMGFSVIVIDHHKILGDIPAAEIVIDPQQQGDESDYKYLANVGITFLLAEKLLGESMSISQKNSFLELVALATISDMVPQIEDNKIFIEEGLRSIKNTFRPGLRAFLEVLGEGEVAAGGFMQVIQAINAAESINFTNDSYQLLISGDARESQELVEKLLGKVRLKSMKIQEIAKEVQRRVAKKPGEPIIFEGDLAWKLTLAGPVASIIAQDKEKPTFIYKKMDSESCGSVRSLKPEQDSVEAMTACKDLLITYGGHAKASGFRLKNENLEKFKTCLIEHFKNK